MSGGTRVTADDGSGPPESVTIADNYVLIVDGTAHLTTRQVQLAEDGTWTHTLTIKGCKPTAAPKPLLTNPVIGPRYYS